MGRWIMAGLLSLAVPATPALAQWERFVEVARQVEPSVVTVKALRGPRRQALGSGVIYRADGYIVTTADVVRGAREVEIVQVRPEGNGGRQEIVHPGKVVGVDAVTGVAVVKVEADGLPAAAFGDSDRVEKGAWIMVMGNSLGLASSLAMGVVSNKEVLENGLLQLSAPVNPGNSGAPVFDDRGEVVGLVVTTGRYGLQGVLPTAPTPYAQPGQTFFFGRAGEEEGAAARAFQEAIEEWRRQVPEWRRTLQEQLRELRERQRETGEQDPQVQLDLQQALAAVQAAPQVAADAARVAIAMVQPEAPQAEGLQEAVEGYTKRGLRILGPDGEEQVIITQGLPGVGAVQGLNFALPGNTVRHIAEQLIQHGKVVRGLLGVVINDVPEELRAQLRLPAGQGVLVAQVNEDSPARKGGLQTWDVILSFAGKAVDSPALLKREVAHSRPGDAVEVEVARGGERLRLSVTPEEAPAPRAALSWATPPTTVFAQPGAAERPWLGVTVDDELSPALTHHFGLDHGLAARRVHEDSPADRAGLRKGDVLLEIDGQRITTLDGLREHLLQQTKPGQQVELLILREGERQTIAVEIGARRGLAGAVGFGAGARSFLVGIEQGL